MKESPLLIPQEGNRTDYREETGVLRRKYAVLFIDSYAPGRMFWTLRSAHKFAARNPLAAIIYERCGLGWRKWYADDSLRKG